MSDPTYRIRKGPRKVCDLCEEIPSTRGGARHKIRHAEPARVTSSDGRDLCWNHYNQEVTR